MNVAELIASSSLVSFDANLLIKAATPYLGIGSDPRLLEIYEAAHSVMLVSLSNIIQPDTLVAHIVPYLDTLFHVFPENLSHRQFRMAIRSLVRITSPPSAIAEQQPLLPSIILDMVRARFQQASIDLLPEKAAQPDSSEMMDRPEWTEQSVLVATIIDALPSLPNNQLEDWLPQVVECLDKIPGKRQQATCTRRLWEVITNGEMDVDRASSCVAWWTTWGGRKLVLDRSITEDQGPSMSGALQETSNL